MIPVSRPYYSPKEITRILEEINKILISGELINGSNLIDFENSFSKYIGSDYSIGVNSGTSALELALKCIDVRKYDVITISNTCNAVPNSIITAGGRPVLIDIKNSLGVDEIVYVR